MENQELGKESVQQVKEPKTTEQRDLANKLDAVGWGLFFIWIGIAFLTDVDVGVGLLGVGVITLGMQAVRQYFKLKLKGFWVVVGLFFLAGGLWELFAVKLPLVPILLIMAGLILLVSVAGGKHLIKK